MKRTLPMVFGGLALVAALCAGGTNVGIGVIAALPAGAEVEPASEAAVADAKPRPAPRPRVLDKTRYIEGILKRNIFDHTAIGQTGTTTNGAVTDLAVTLMGTLVSTNSRMSLATIVDDKATFPTTYGVGDKLEDATVIAIEKGRVTLRRASGAEEFLLIEEGKRPTTKAASKSGSDEEGISKDGENQFTVDKDLVDRYLTDLDALGRMGRAIPHRGPDGQVDGYRLSGIRRNSMGEKLGIRNGDIVHSVNGQGLTSMQGAMAAYTALQSESSFSFEVTRRGQKMSLQYEIR